jgi:ATP-binding protein involved in chromosome partitioning
MALTQADVASALSGVQDYEPRSSIAELDMVGDITVSDLSLAVQIDLTVVGCPAADTIEAHTRKALLVVAGERTRHVTLGSMSPQQQDRPITEGRIDLLCHDIHRSNSQGCGIKPGALHPAF